MTIFFVSLLLIVYTMIGYPLLLSFLSKHLKKKVIKKRQQYAPKITCIVTAHNEESVLREKLINLEECLYAEHLFEIIVTSDFSTDQTNAIVEQYISEYKGKRTISLHKTKEHKGKTNAQNEAVRLASGELLIFTDANSLLGSESLQQLVQNFSDAAIGYVAGKLVYTNQEDSATSQSESSYWDYDLEMRQQESNLSSITAGNGALYAIRKSLYKEIPLTYSHDSYFPPYVVTKGYRAVFEKEAVVYEKAGKTEDDEFKRKVRMSRNIFTLNFILPQKYNVFRCGWFSLFYLSHRTFRNNLYLFHLVAFFSNCWLAVNSGFFLLFLLGQILIYSLAFLGRNKQQPLLHLLFYYCLTLVAQGIGVGKELTGRSKSVWEKAESTRE